LENRRLREQIHQANVKAHRFEAKYFEMLHPEIYNMVEQKRLTRSLKKIAKLVSSNGKKALDFGAGTGNVTGKLLRMGYEVTAVDISKEMCKVLRNRYADFVKRGTLHVINSEIEDVALASEEFDLITCYAVLHHIPDYGEVIKKVSLSLKKGGVIYLDHENSAFQGSVGRVARLYHFSDWFLNVLTGSTYLQVANGKDEFKMISKREFALADYWGQPDRKIDNAKIEHVLKELNFSSYLQINYHLHRTKIFNPFFYIFKYASDPDVSCWIAKK
jgi:2-polyprenyl-3-methyl-5-hydroxy-6-metoxy-1,4-benzoquinol methylase